ncbi:putative molybdopterin oxidoreductase, molybdopterin-containing subunit [Candidatus Kuenenia stuttgartiensis]|uniref:Putative molybdopterin oxidoreductase, molybdopterin-containing subunit n=1 Tax=Kuenenia stuttgartiensis TaxID=174633 RepID=Q1PWG5_KUEST|nr:MULTISPECIES: molybdopterin-dependent oxidoreductase [Kuenenia]MBE7545894.1 molybdopterin-dependent oxidoreductase [Planctomycetia bacterium]MBZ0190901.1 molybdopterin-dependent oxidoreductase [Candidatus Kuenenia stuttgartiensis]MCF6152196.1 4Fe-4S dicluster domain-containing protein [Candidatus Kuenenia stuttgartiensis]MCL4727349.1 molybdopterin-dependent oxidoreductase [Candidatus Kuenenia stuttgartiensis]MCZ7622915.1 molybdopterin-dependent oxidoreductase [Candidatus Kuenenia sp.]
MKIIHLTIDDKSIVAPEGTNIFQAALDNNIYIPGLCYHPKLSQFGGCRLCYVEVTERNQTRRRFACAHPVSEGMSVKVNTAEVNRHRKAVMEYLLAHHELACPTCNKSGECGLQNIAHEQESPLGRFKTARMSAPVIRDNPVLELNRNRCVLCGRCVNACKEIEGVGAIDFQNRGFRTVIGTAFDRPLDCSFCGGCLAVCPTGAWQDRTLKFSGRSWEFEGFQTICPYCSVGCTIVLNTKNGSVRRVLSEDKLGINEGNLCVKGRFGHEFIHSPERITTPLIKKNGEFQAVRWEEAIGFVSETLGRIIEKHGSNTIGGIGSEKCTNEEDYLFQKFCRTVLRTNCIDNIANMRAPFLNSVLYKSVESGFAAAPLKEIENAGTLFFFGVDITEALPVIGCMARKAIKLNNANVVIANPRTIIFKNTAPNEARLNYSLGSQHILLNAIIKVIVEDKLVDIKKLESSASNLSDLRLAVENLSLIDVERLTGVSPEMIRNAAGLLAKPGNCCIVYGKDVIEDPLGADTIKTLLDLCTLIDISNRSEIHPGRVSLFCARYHNNSQGVNDMGVVPESLPGYLDINDASNKERIEELWGVKFSEDLLSKKPLNLIDAAKNGSIKSLYVMGADPVTEYPNGKEIRDSFKNMEFIVVQDSFMTETAKQADVIFPSATFAEKEGTYTSMGLITQRLNKAVSPVGESKADWKIICDVSEKMGHAFPYANVTEIVDEIKKAAPLYSSLSYDRLKRKEFHWPSSFPEKKESNTCTFFAIQGKFLKVNVEKEFPFIVMTGASLNHHGAYSAKSRALVSIAPECCVEINEKDAKDMQIKNGDMVMVESRVGKLKLRARVTKKSPPGIVFVPDAYADSPVNILISQAYTPVKIYTVSDLVLRLSQGE